jgi:hypothetical protein
MTALFSLLVSWYSSDPPGLTTCVLKAPIDGLTHVLLQEQPHQQQASRPPFCTEGVRASCWRARWIWEGCLAKSRPASRCPDDVMARFGGGRMGCRKLAASSIQLLLFSGFEVVCRWRRIGRRQETSSRIGWLYVLHHHHIAPARRCGSTAAVI